MRRNDLIATIAGIVAALLILLGLILGLVGQSINNTNADTARQKNCVTAGGSWKLATTIRYTPYYECTR